MMCGSVASFQPIGTMLSRLNANTPTELVPALSNNWAPAFNSTPVMSSERLVAFMVLLLESCSSTRRRAHENAFGVARDYLHRQLLLFEPRELFEAHHGERVVFAPPARFEFSD